MDWLSDPDIWLSFVTLTVLEIVLGIDNVVFISILSGKLPAEQQARARTVGLGLAMVMRILLLLAISWVIGLTAPLFQSLGQEISGRDIIMLAGGLFLIAKATFEIHEKLEGVDPHTGTGEGGVVHLGDRADPRPRHRVQPRLGDHRGRDG